MTLVMVRYDKISKRLFRDGEIVGLLLLCGDDRWGVSNLNGDMLSKRRYLRAKDALAAAETLL